MGKREVAVLIAKAWRRQTDGFAVGVPAPAGRRGARAKLGQAARYVGRCAKVAPSAEVPTEWEACGRWRRVVALISLLLAHTNHDIMI